MHIAATGMKTKALLACTLLLAWSYPVALAAPPAALHLDRKGERWAAKTLRHMPLEEKVGQMIMVWAKVRFLNDASPEYVALHEEMDRYHVGGFGVTVEVDGAQLLKSEPLEAAALTNHLQRDSKYPLLFAADFERGLSMRLNSATAFPAAMAFGAAGNPELAREFGRISALETRAIGIHWNWFPVADVNSNPANPIIDTRSFGEDPSMVSRMIDAYIEGAHQSGMLTTVKHFPGHGDTDTDSHLALARVTGNLDRLNSVELAPFRSAIAAGVDSVMVGHLLVPAIESDANLPASISPNVITGLLKQKLGFNGIVVTDALDMAGLTKVFSGSKHEVSAQAAVAAVRAGNDMIIIPGDLDGAYTGLLNAVHSGQIPESRIDASVRKILRMKAALGLEHNRLVSLADVEKNVALPASTAFAQKVADEAITLVADSERQLPLPPASGVVAVIFTDYTRGSEGSRVFVNELRKRAPDAQIFWVNESNAESVQAGVLAAAANAQHVIALAEAVPNPRRTTEGRSGGSVNLDAGPLQLLSKMVETAGGKTVLTAFGNPYIGSEVPGLRAYVCTFSNTTSSGIALVRALFGEIPIHGRLPVSIPNVAVRGIGFDRNATALQ
ncbi:MAG TPA: glycoside hydrolase family 3 N-terminal domain-containing protein [Acidisarcina sp.]|nr:glycoside hydrolase family 3 N-terminal domain-containing protein [Acidisarcina sp.]